LTQPKSVKPERRKKQREKGWQGDPRNVVKTKRGGKKIGEKPKHLFAPKRGGKTEKENTPGDKKKKGGGGRRKEKEKEKKKWKPTPPTKTHQLKSTRKHKRGWWVENKMQKGG